MNCISQESIYFSQEKHRKIKKNLNSKGGLYWQHRLLAYTYAIGVGGRNYIVLIRKMYCYLLMEEGHTNRYS
jgi:hypothetical protein